MNIQNENQFIRGNRAGVVIRDKDGAFLLMRRIKPHADYYGVLGGHIEPEETAQKAAVREVKEEAGVDVILKNLILEVENQGRTEFYYDAVSWSGVPTLGGEELERTCPENQYILEWVSREKLSLIVLYPQELHELLMSM